MKARHTPLTAAVLYGGFDEESEKTLRKCADRCAYKAIKAAADNGSATVSSIFAGKPDSTLTPLCDEEFIIINGGGANSARLIDKLRENGLVIPLKALVTLHNQEWQLNELITELKNEHRELSEREGKAI